MALARLTPANILLIFRSQLLAIHQTGIIASESGNDIIGTDLNDEPSLIAGTAENATEIRPALR